MRNKNNLNFALSSFLEISFKYKRTNQWLKFIVYCSERKQSGTKNLNENMYITLMAVLPEWFVCVLLRSWRRKTVYFTIFTSLDLLLFDCFALTRSNRFVHETGGENIYLDWVCLLTTFALSAEQVILRKSDFHANCKTIMKEVVNKIMCNCPSK